jgi:putative PIG3 family NAD(P)H quinone oxidoreductase
MARRLRGTTLGFMLAITASQFGGPDVLRLTEVPDPAPGPSEVLIEVAATAVNRADLLQRDGNYPPPPGASPILGMECSGTVAAVGDEVRDWQVGDQVCALLAGGGYAELVNVPAAQVLPVPAGVAVVDAAALPEVACTVWSNLMIRAGLRSGQTVLIHGGASGIGTMAIQVTKAAGATSIVTASRDRSLERCRELGADVAINYAETDFVSALMDATDGRGADVILDLIGAKYLQRNISALAFDGTLVIVGMQGGTTAELDIRALMARRGAVVSTALRSRPVTGPGSKGEIITAVRDHLWPLVAAGSVRPVIDVVLPLARAGDAHRRMAEGGHFGKIVLATQ